MTDTATEHVVQVDVCVNDTDHGMPMGHIVALAIPSEDFEQEGLYLYPRDNPRFAYLPSSGWIRVGRRRFAIRGRKSWVGNWSWDAVWMSAAGAGRLVAYLRERGWRATAGPAYPPDWLGDEVGP